MVRHWYVKDESNVSWSIYMYTYLRSVGPLSSWSSLFYMEFSFLHRVLIFSKVWVSDSKLRWLFSLLLTRVISCDIDPLGKTWYRHTSLSSAPLSQGLPILPDIFPRKGIMEPTLPDAFDCPPTWSCPQVFKSGLGMRLYEGRFGYLQRVVFM